MSRADESIAGHLYDRPTIREHGFDTDRLFAVLVTEDFYDTEAMLDEEDVDGAVFDGSTCEAWFAEHDLACYPAE